MELIIDDFRITFSVGLHLSQNMILTSPFHQLITNFIIDHAFYLNFFYKTQYFVDRENYFCLLNMVVDL
jgi:hypothetical protein